MVDQTLGDSELMRSNGWEVNTMYDKNSRSINACNNKFNDENFYGWSVGDDVAELSYTFSGDGEYSIEFGNCWTEGAVMLYYNDVIAGNFFHTDLLLLQFLKVYIY